MELTESVGVASSMVGSHRCQVECELTLSNPMHLDSHVSVEIHRIGHCEPALNKTFTKFGYG